MPHRLPPALTLAELAGTTLSLLELRTRDSLHRALITAFEAGARTADDPRTDPVLRTLGRICAEHPDITLAEALVRLAVACPEIDLSAILHGAPVVRR